MPCSAAHFEQRCSETSIPHPSPGPWPGQRPKGIQGEHHDEISVLPSCVIRWPWERGALQSLCGRPGATSSGWQKDQDQITLDFGKIHSHTGPYGLSGWNWFNCSITVHSRTSQTIEIIRRRLANIFQALTMCQTWAKYHTCIILTESCQESVFYHP